MSVGYFTRPEEVMVEIRNRLYLHRQQLGFDNVYLGDDTQILQFPACQIVGDPAGRTRETTNQFSVTFLLTLWIYHASLMEDHQQRTITDMELATKVVDFLHLPAQRRLVDEDGDDKLIFSYVYMETPGRITREQGPSIITTRLGWTGDTRVNFSS